MASRMIETGQISIATESFGSPGDIPVVLVMGATTSMLGWPDAFCEALARRGHFVIRFDHRDTGQTSTRPPGGPDYAVEDMAGDVIAVLDGYGLGAAHLMGMSLGGLISQMVAVGDSGRAASLTLLGSEPLGWDGAELPHIAPEFLAHFGALATLDWSDQPAVEAFLLEIDRLCAGSAQPFDQLGALSRIRQVLDRTESPASMFNHAGLSVRDDWTGAFRRIACPTLVIHGAEDSILPPENGRAITAGIPGAQLSLLPGMGHELPPVLLERIAAMVADHITTARAAAP